MRKWFITAVALSFLIINDTDIARAGFYGWLNETGKYEPSGIVTSGEVESGKNISFENIFAWENRQRASKTQELIVTDVPKLEIKVLKTYNVRATAYSSTPDQTDDTPFITAKGTYVRDGIIAANFLPFGTKIRIPGIYGDKIFVVEDRMNKRYWYNIDIWFPERHQALTFGSQKVIIEIVEES